ncbi:MAG: hypothetical protein EOP64_00340 [Sphingomonas sp.]|nr:MAG: hypothetical protein EOP64_00340 [Sphingomonas sp.]
MTTQFGLGPLGFKIQRQSDVIAAISVDLQNALGSNISLGADTVWGKVIGVVSEREAYLWELLETIWNSQFPSGAEGLAVDNLLAANNLARLGTRSSVTDPTPALGADGTTLYGLVLGGTVGTLIQKGAIISTASLPVRSFTLDADVTIAKAVNAVQTLVLSATPSQGSFTLTLTSSNNALVSRPLPYRSYANRSQVVFASTPTGGTYQLMVGPFVTAPLAYNASAAQVQAAVVPLTAQFAGLVVDQPLGTVLRFNWAAGTFNPVIEPNGINLGFAQLPSVGSVTLGLGSTNATVAAPVTAASLQAAIVAAGYPLARVAPNAANTFAISFRVASPPGVSVVANSTQQSISIASLNQTGVAMSAIDSVQSVINNLYDPGIAARPFTDAIVTDAGNGYSVAFGGGTPRTGEPSSAAKPIALIIVSQSTLQTGSSIVNLSVAPIAAGSAAQAVGSATATIPGDIQVAAGKLTVIGTPVTGWSSVTNQLDVIPGAAVESDNMALIRRGETLSSAANGPLPSIIAKVSLLDGVVNVVGFVNSSDAALQTLSFASVPTSGSFNLLFGNGGTASIGGNGLSAGTVQAALNAIPGYQSANVTGTVAYGLSIDFQGAFGGQAQPLVQVTNNTTAVAIAAAFGRPARAIEMVVQGGNTQSIANAIYNASPAASVFYGTPAAITTGSAAQGSATLTVAQAGGIAAGQIVSGLGMQAGARVAVVSGTQVTLSATAIGSYATATYTFTTASTVTDAYGNVSLVSFSRPTPLLVYVTVALVTDQYRTPGLPSSGVNPLSKFAPQSMAQIQQDICDIGNASPIGGLIIGAGTGGLIGAFNEVPGILGYSLMFGTAPNPSANQNVQLLPTQVASFQQSLVSVSYT